MVKTIRNSHILITLPHTSLCISVSFLLSLWVDG